MKKSTVKALAVFAILLVAFNAIAFAVPFVRDGTFWTGYVFSVVAILLAAGIWLYAMGRPDTLKSQFYGLPLIGVAWRYLALQLVCSLLFMTVAVIPIWVAILVSSLLLAACAIGLIATDMGRAEVERVDRKVAEKQSYLKSIQAELVCQLEKRKDTPLYIPMKKLVETVQYSDPISDPSLATLESEIKAKAALLCDSLNCGDQTSAEGLISELQQLLFERNQKCKLQK